VPAPVTARIPLKAPAANPAARLNALPIKSLVSVAHRAHNASTIRVILLQHRDDDSGVLCLAPIGQLTCMTTNLFRLTLI
jgi:hypothetical protein